MQDSISLGVRGACLQPGRPGGRAATCSTTCHSLKRPAELLPSEGLSGKLVEGWGQGRPRGIGGSSGQLGHGEGEDWALVGCGGVRGLPVPSEGCLVMLAQRA